MKQDVLSSERLQGAVDFCLSELTASSSTTTTTTTKNKAAAPSYSFLATGEDNGGGGSSSNALKGQAVRGYQQVVAGMNYRLVVVVRRQQEQSEGDAEAADDSEPIGAFAVTVYVRFDGEMSVTKWGKEVDVAKAMEMLETSAESNVEMLGRSNGAGDAYNYDNADFDGDD